MQKLHANKRFKLKGNLFKVLYYIENVDNNFSSQNLASFFGVTNRAIRENLKQLKEMNVIERVPYKRWYKYLINSEEDWNV